MNNSEDQSSSKLLEKASNKKAKGQNNIRAKIPSSFGKLSEQPKTQVDEEDGGNLVEKSEDETLMKPEDFPDGNTFSVYK